MATNKPILTWLHLSDIHYGHGDASHQSDQRLVLQALSQDLRGIVKTSVPRPDVILITGDLAFSGNVRRRDEYKSVRRWIESVGKDLKVAADHIFVIPGNHDLQRDVGESIANLRDLKIKLRGGSERIDNSLSDATARLLLKKQFSNYLSFARNFGPRLSSRRVVVADLFWVYSLKHKRPLSVRLVGLNTAILCAREEDEYGDLKRLQMGKHQLVRAFTSPEVDRTSEIVVVMTHHPLEWLRDRVDIEAALKRYAHVHLYGHIHDAATEERRSGSGTDIIEVVAGATHDEVAQPGTIPRHGYNLASIYVSKQRPISPESVAKSLVQDTRLQGRS